MNIHSMTVSALIILFICSCAPKDQKIVRPDTRVNPTGTSSPTEAKADNYKYLAVLLDRQSEVLQLYKILTNAEYAVHNSYKVEDFEFNFVKFKKISAQVNSLSSQIAVKSNVSLLAQVTSDEKGNLQQILITENKEVPSTESATKEDKSNIVLKNNSKKILIEKSKTDQSFNVTVDQNDELNAKAGKSFQLNTLKFNFSENADVYKINSVEVKHNRYGVQTMDFSMKSAEGSDLQIQLTDQCVSLTGQLVLNSIEVDKVKNAPLYVRKLNYKDSSLILVAGNDTYDLKAASCAERPVVDISRLF